MKLLIINILTVTMAMGLLAQNPTDSLKIQTTLSNYVEGWYKGDVELMKKAILPITIKRIVARSAEIGNNENVLSEKNYSQLIEQTRLGIGKRPPPDRQMSNISILRVYNNSASVEIEMSDWIEYLHLGRWNGEWKIINILWEMKPQD